ncbi:MAG: hypothetical protein KGL95_15965, partial [Patescibacteria group bacterium]|nr:hypothetical protein [Patescibacteria group bacterium]
MKILHLAIFSISIGFMLVTLTLISSASGLSFPTRQVLYMKPNSTGHLYVTFSTVLHNQTMSLAPLNIFDTNQTNHNRFNNVSGLSMIPNRTSIVLDNNSTVVDYAITAKNNLKGLYEFSLPETCGIYPLVIGLDSSQINPYVLLFGFTDHGCTIYPPPIRAKLASSLYTTFSLPESDLQTISEPQPPLKQFRSGVSLDDIECKKPLVLFFKTQDHSPLCLTIGTADILSRRNIIDTSDNMTNLIAHEKAQEFVLSSHTFETLGIKSSLFVDQSSVCLATFPEDCFIQILFDGTHPGYGNGTNEIS